MKILKRFVSIILSCLFIINLSPSIQAIEPTESSDQLTEYIVPVISNEYNKPTVIFYEYENKYYLNIKDIIEFTRCEISENDSSIILTHGLREIVIDKETGHMTDTTIVDQGIIPFLKFDEEYLCEGVPMLLYLGAACTIRNNEALEILMPTFTIWESIMPNYLDFYFDISELYGGENNVKERLFFDILSDVLDGVSGHGLFANGDVHLEDALYEILNVDIMKYASVQEEIALQNSDINNFISSDSVMNILQYNLETGNQIIDSTNSIIEQYSNFYLNAEIWKNEKLWQHYYKLDDMDSVSELSTKINQQVYEQSVLKSNNKYIDSIQETLDLGILALDTAVTSYNLMRYDQDTKNLFRNTINDEVLNYAGYYDISWDNISNKISNTLSSNSSIIKNTATGKVAEYVINKVTSEGVEQALKGFTNKANIYATALEIGLFISSLINRDYHEAHSAEMNAIWLSTVQYDIAQLTARMLKREWTESRFSNTETLEYLKYMFSLYYRTTIAFAENIAISVEEFGGKNKNQLVKYFSSTTEASVGNYSAIYLYRMTNCTLVPIVDYNLITDDFLSSEWMNSFKLNTEISIPIHQGHTLRVIFVDSETNALITDKVYACLYTGPEEKAFGLERMQDEVISNEYFYYNLPSSEYYFLNIRAPEWYVDINFGYITLNKDTDNVLVTVPLTKKKLIVDDVLVTPDNSSDILGDGTAIYDEKQNLLTLTNANIEARQPIYSNTHINIKIPQGTLTNLSVITDTYYNAIDVESVTIWGGTVGSTLLSSSDKGGSLYVSGSGYDSVSFSILADKGISAYGINFVLQNSTHGIRSGCGNIYINNCDITGIGNVNPIECGILNVMDTISYDFDPHGWNSGDGSINIYDCNITHSSDKGSIIYAAGDISIRDSEVILSGSWKYLIWARNGVLNIGEKNLIVITTDTVDELTDNLFICGTKGIVVHDDINFMDITGNNIVECETYYNDSIDCYSVRCDEKTYPTHIFLK